MDMTGTCMEIYNQENQFDTVILFTSDCQILMK